MQRRTRWLPATAALFYAGTAAAEPGASGTHVPLLIALVAAVAVLIGATPYALTKLRILKLSTRVAVVTGSIMAIAFALFLGPLILALGSILITGRTM